MEVSEQHHAVEGLTGDKNYVAFQGGRVTYLPKSGIKWKSRLKTTYRKIVLLAD
jgi:hypothetical protein